MVPALIAALITLPLLTGCATVTPETATYANPVLYADYSDPDVIRVGEDYYHVSSSFHLSPGIPVLKSLDLINWTIIGHVLPKLPFAPEYDMPGPFEIDDTKSKPVTGTRYASGVWAPSIRHHNGLFYVYWATPDEGVFMSTAATPEGPWSEPVHVIKQARLEDPCPIWDDDGQAYLVHGRVGAGPLILRKMAPDGLSALDDGVVIAEDKVNLPVLEGPKFIKRNGFYYIFAPIGGVDKGPQAVGRAKDIYGPYEWRVVLEPGTTAVQGPHQGGYVETPSGEGWFLHFNSTGAFGRINHLQPVRWVDDWPVMGEPIAGKVSGQPVMTYPRPDTGVLGRDKMQASDEFSSTTLGLQWQWNHNPDNTRWSLSERPGYLRLKAGQADHLTTSRNTLTQMLTGPFMRSTARLDISGMTDGQRAGLTLFGVKPVWIGAVRENGINRITFTSAGIETTGPVLTGDTVMLRAEVGEDQVAHLAYSLDGKAFTALGKPTALAKFSWWKGSRPGVFTFNKDSASGHVDIDSFRVDHEVAK
ncbi:glycoside hydrolase family 43 protein [Asticcacaulis endophyticus]|nr:glycoside hydrolase 43 family protein [Asticcacaulis endophyticus]